MAVTVVDSVESIRNLIKEIEGLASEPHFLFMDLEGVNLSRHGSIAILQVFVPATDSVYLVDVLTLQSQAFKTPGVTGTTLKTILESSSIPKVCFDIRNDSDALFSHFQINVHGIVDLQLLEFATRPFRGRFLNGLSKCISQMTGTDRAERVEYHRIKDAGQALFAPERGGTYEVFNQRPIPQAIIDYCAQDVTILPKLLTTYAARLTDDLATQVHEETLRRISLSQSPSFNGKGMHMAVGPSFSWSRRPSHSPPPFPLNIVRSNDLSKYCSSTVSQTTTSAKTSSEENPTDIGAAGLDSLTLRSSPNVRTTPFARDYDDYDHEDHDEYDDSSPKDFTACSANDCGFCGRCGY